MTGFSRFLKTRREASRLVVAAISVVLAISLDYLRDRSAAVFGADAVYARIVTRGFRAAIPRYTALVEIRDSHEPAEVLQTNACEQRRFLARVIRRILTAHPSVIVLDKYFQADVCTSNAEGTRQLQAAVGDALNDNVPVVVGRYLGPGAPKDLDFPRSDNGTAVIRSDLRLEEDLRRVPLAWDESDTLGPSASNLDTLSLAASLAHSPKLLTVDSRLARFRNHDESPYASLLPLGAYDPYSFSALDLLCGTAIGTGAWRDCPPPPGPTQAQLRGRIVVVGEDSGGHDAHRTVAGVVLGDKLQAMYIEAILDDALLSTSRALNWIGGIVAIAVFVFLLYEFESVVRIVLSIGLLVLVYLVASALTKWGYYLDWQIGVILIGLLAGDIGIAAEKLFNDSDRGRRSNTKGKFMNKKALILLIAVAVSAPVAAISPQQADKPTQGDNKAKKPGAGGIGGTPGKMAAKEKSGTKSSSAAKSVTGTVSAVSAHTITVRDAGGDVTFNIDDDTLVTKGTYPKGLNAKGISTKSGSPSQGTHGVKAVTDMLKTGDNVSVRYTAAGDTKIATVVTLRTGGS